MKIAGCDYAQGPSPTQLKLAGFRFVCRYLSTPGNPKNISLAEHAALRELGLRVVLVYETTADRALSGHVAGLADAHSARVQLLEAGFPVKTPVYFAVDFNCSVAQLPQVLAYLRGAASVLGRNRTGVYAGGRVLRAAKQAKLCRYRWQSAATAWGTPDPSAQIRQGAQKTVGGHTVDLDVASRVDYGQTPRPAVPFRVLDGLIVRPGSLLARWVKAL